MRVYMRTFSNHRPLNPNPPHPLTQASGCSQSRTVFQFKYCGGGDDAGDGDGDGDGDDDGDVDGDGDDKSDDASGVCMRDACCTSHVTCYTSHVMRHCPFSVELE